MKTLKSYVTFLYVSKIENQNVCTNLSKLFNTFYFTKRFWVTTCRSPQFIFGTVTWQIWFGFNSFCGTKSYVILLWKRLLNWSLCCCAFKMRFQLVSEGVGHVSISLMVTKLKIASFGTDHRSTTISWNTLQAGKIQGAFKSGYQNSWFKFKLDFSQDELLKLI